MSEHDFLQSVVDVDEDDDILDDKSSGQDRLILNKNSSPMLRSSNNYGEPVEPDGDTYLDELQKDFDNVFDFPNSAGSIMSSSSKGFEDSVDE